MFLLTYFLFQQFNYFIIRLFEFGFQNFDFLLKNPGILCLFVILVSLFFVFLLSFVPILLNFPNLLPKLAIFLLEYLDRAVQ